MQSGPGGQGGSGRENVMDAGRAAGKERAVVVFSGGLDSACTAAIQGSRYDTYGITFSYGQRASSEIRAAKWIAKRLGLKQHRTVDIGFMRNLYGDSNVLTGSRRESLPGAFDYSIVVPIRNAVFLSMATAWAFSIGATRVAYGAHADDKRYPDCRPSFTKKVEAAFNEGEADGIKKGLRGKIEIWSPYRAGLTKKDLITRGIQTLGDTIFKTWSCYADKRLQCGRCESCINRKRALEAAGVTDKTRYLAE